MPTRNQVNTTITTLLTPQSGSDKVSASEVRQATAAILDYADQQDTAAIAAAASAAGTALTAAVADLQEQIDALPSGSSDEDATPTEFTGSIKFDLRNRVYTADVSDVSNPITIDTAGMAQGKGATVVINNDDDTADAPEFEDVVWINNVTFDPTEGNSTAYILNNVAGTIVGSVIRLGVAVVTPTLSTPSFTATAVSDTQINLTGISYDSDSDAMIIRRATNVGMSANLATIYTGVPKASHNDTGRAASTQYFYDIQTTATGFTDSARGTGNATTQAAGLTQLATPTLSAAPASTTAITLTLGTVANESSYKLEWSANGSTGWTQIGGTIAANTTTYNHTGLTPNTAYFYRLTAVGDGVTYSDSGYGTDDATTTALTQLATPTLTATVISDTEIDLDWTNVANESSFKLERSLNGTTGWTQIGGTIAANTLAYSDTGLTASTHYYYRLSAIGDGTTYSTSGFATDDDTTQAPSGTTITEDFTSTTVGNVPTGWAATLGTVQNASFSAPGAPSGKVFNFGTNTSASQQLIYGTVIPAISTVSCTLYKDTVLNTTEFGITARANTATPGSITDYYLANVRFIDLGNPGGVLLRKVVANTPTQIGSFVKNAWFGTANEEQIYIEHEIGAANLHKVYCQRLVDGLWLDSTGIFVSGKVACISVTDASITGPGYAGINAYVAVGDGADAVVDDITITY